MRLHAVFMIAASTMLVMSALLVLRAHHSDREVRSPYAGLVGIRRTNPADNDLIPVEQTSKQSPSDGAVGR
jgi:hypothetical protein